MNKKPFLDHKLLRKMIAKSGRAKSITPVLPLPATWGKRPAPVDNLFPLSIAKVPQGSPAEAVGHMMSEDGVLVLRLVLDAEAKSKFGARGLTHGEAIAMMHRLAQLSDIEENLVIAQRENVILRQALKELTAEAASGLAVRPRTINKAREALEATEETE